MPGELAGYWAAHQRFGKLPWADLFKPSIELCEKGYVLTLVQYDALEYNKKSIYNDPTLKYVSPVEYKSHITSYKIFISYNTIVHILSSIF